ncbi:hypothetical protein PINS_up004189 [Pythium insidiosum]|nr:hypothetical protein PINS_up004189 [Pythium insidiosum]
MSPCPSEPTVTVDCANDRGIPLSVCLVRPIPGSSECEVDLSCREQSDSFNCESKGIRQVASLPSTLRYLNLRTNQLQLFRPAFPSGTSMLENVVLNENSFDSMDSIHLPPSIRNLYLGMNAISQVKFHARNSAGIESLNLDGAPVTSISDVQLPPSLRYLYLSNANIKKVVFHEGLNRLRLLDTSANPTTEFEIRSHALVLDTAHVSAPNLSQVTLPASVAYASIDVHDRYHLGNASFPYLRGFITNADINMLQPTTFSTNISSLIFLSNGPLVAGFKLPPTITELLINPPRRGSSDRPVTCFIVRESDVPILTQLSSFYLYIQDQSGCSPEMTQGAQPRSLVIAGWSRSVFVLDDETHATRFPTPTVAPTPSLPTTQPPVIIPTAPLPTAPPSSPPPTTPQMPRPTTLPPPTPPPTSVAPSTAPPVPTSQPPTPTLIPQPTQSSTMPSSPLPSSSASISQPPQATVPLTTSSPTSAPTSTPSPTPHPMGSVLFSLSPAPSQTPTETTLRQPPLVATNTPSPEIATRSPSPVPLQDATAVVTSAPVSSLLPWTTTAPTVAQTGSLRPSASPETLPLPPSTRLVPVDSRVSTASSFGGSTRLLLGVIVLVVCLLFCWWRRRRSTAKEDLKVKSGAYLRQQTPRAHGNPSLGATTPAAHSKTASFAPHGGASTPFVGCLASEETYKTSPQDPSRLSTSLLNVNDDEATEKAKAPTKLSSAASNHSRVVLQPLKPRRSRRAREDERTSTTQSSDLGLEQ